MPEVFGMFSDDLPSPLGEATFKAKAGTISPAQFLKIFEQCGVGNIERLAYAHKAFNLSLEELKRIEQARDRGLTESESEEIITTLNQLQSES